MDPVSRLNASIEAHLPAAWRCLSPLGRRFYFPVDIPAQSAEARGTAINATIEGWVRERPADWNWLHNRWRE